MSSFASRLDAAILHAGINQTALAERLRVHRQTISALKHGKIGTERVPEIARILGVDAHWLESGDGAAPTWFVGGSPQLRDAKKPAPHDAAIAAKVHRLETLVDALTRRVDQLLEENTALRAQLQKRSRRG